MCIRDGAGRVAVENVVMVYRIPKSTAYLLTS
jgi:hypothetical protein